MFESFDWDTFLNALLQFFLEYFLPLLTEAFGITTS